ncbi:MAG: AAA family ATPase [Nitrospinae bacterium]|nr:AAA family ATPase [Nitrospinota bacterium]
MITLQGYSVQKKIFENLNSSIFRALRVKDGLKVVVKLLNEEYPTPQELGRFQLEYETACLLDMEGVPHICSLEKYRNSLAIVMEDCGGDSLKNLLSDGAMPLAEFYDVALKIVNALQQIHSHLIIHKDLNPSNIIYNPDSGVVQIIDFGIASLLSREEPEIKDFNKLEGNLKYISPEQTGRMNRSINYHSDFYSLGITFYELLTGELPFDSADPMEQVHMHIAKIAVPPHQINTLIPQPLSDIVMKLMEKNAEERYQSIYGLIHDLKKCSEEYKATGSVKPFKIAELDISDTFQIPQKLYGREKDTKTLLSAFDRLSMGVSEILLVTGYSGIGKSVLVNEVRKPILKSRGYFIEGKFDQFSKDIPYGAVSIAFKNLIKQIASESEENVKVWREKLNNALGQNGQIIVDIIPELEGIIGKQSAVQELMPSEAKNRFFITFRNFVKVFADKNHPLVIFLDDLQWADVPSLSLITDLMGSESIRFFLFIGAYRSNEVNEGHPLALALHEMEIKRQVSQITLGTLSEDNIGQLVSDTLKCNIEEAHSLTSLIQQKTDGNPFFINELLKNLHRDDYICFDKNKGRWCWDIEKIRGVEISENVVEFMVKRLGKLPEEIKKCLQNAASIGNSFDLKTLSLITEKTPEETAKILQPTIDEGIISPQNNDYRLFLREGEVSDSLSTAAGIHYTFQHDRVQYAAYSLSSENEREEAHLRIGRLLKNKLDKTEIEEKVIVIARHFNEGRKRVTGNEEKKEITLLNLKAGRKAKASSAYRPAYQYLGIAYELLPENHWKTDYPLAWEVVWEYAESAYLSKEFEHSNKLMDLLDKNSKDVMGKVEVLRMRSEQFVAMGTLNKGIDSCIQGLSLLGLKLPANPTKLHIIVEMMRAKFYLGKRNISDLIHEPEMKEEKNKYCMKLLMELTPIVYKAGTKNLMILVGLKEAVLSLRYGMCPESAFAFVAYGMLQGAVFKDFEKGYEFGKLGVRLNEHYNDIRLRSRIFVVYGIFTAFWNIHYRELEKVFQLAIEAGLQSGDHSYLAFSCVHISLWGTESNLRQAIQKGEKYLSIIESTKNNEAYIIALFAQKMRIDFAGKEKSFHPFIETFNEEECFERLKKAKDVTGECRCLVLKLENYFYFEEYEQCMQQIEKVEKHAISIIGTYSFFHLSLYTFYTLSSMLHEMTQDKRNVAVKKMKGEYEKMKLWANHCPVNFLHHKLLMEAELSAIEGDLNDAFNLFDEAIKVAEKNDYLRFQALANERAAKFYLSIKKEKIASFYFTEALYLYRKWGGEEVAKNIEKKYSSHLNIVSPIPKHDTTVDFTISNTSSGSHGISLDISSIIKATRAISGEIVLETLLEKILKIVIENAGAERGVFILQDGETEELNILSQWDIEDKKTKTFISQPLDEYENVPVNIIKTSQKSFKPIILNDASKNFPESDHNYFAGKNKKSVICYPILKHGKVFGLIYLENDLIAGAFTQERVELLEILAAQAATSIENANLYQNLDEYSHTLEEKVKERTNELIESQEKLIQTEKMASLGGLVAGVAHEINTPIGIGITSASYLKDGTDKLLKMSETDSMKKSEFEKYLKEISRCSDLILRNLKRTAELVSSFKMVSTDQTNYERRKFKVADYINDILCSLTPEIRKSSLIATLHCNESIVMENYPGALAQVLTNFVMNSIKHGYEKQEKGNITITVEELKDSITIEYKDDGKGIPEKNMKKIFDPFFTTRRDLGGTGLGLHIVFNAVDQILKGKITCESIVGKGTTFHLTLPKKLS